MPKRIALAPPRAWWRIKADAALQQKACLEAYLNGRMRQESWFYGSRTWPIMIKGTKIYTWRASSDGGLRGWSRSKQRLAGRLHGKYLVLHAKRAPRWLRNWARFRENVFVLPKLDKGTLAAHLVQRKLLGLQEEELPF